MRAADSNTLTHTAKAQPDDPQYKQRVAQPVMEAVDNMPCGYRELVHNYGYVDVYRQWKRGASVQDIHCLAKKLWFPNG